MVEEGNDVDPESKKPNDQGGVGLPQTSQTLIDLKKQRAKTSHHQQLIDRMIVNRSSGGPDSAQFPGVASGDVRLSLSVDAGLPQLTDGDSQNMSPAKTMSIDELYGNAPSTPKSNGHSAVGNGKLPEEGEGGSSHAHRHRGLEDSCCTLT